MSNLTLQLPETLHRQLINIAETEGVSLDQYIVYALTRQVTLAYTVQPISESAINQQKEAFTALLQNLRQASFAEINLVLDEREAVVPERELTPDVVERLQQRIASSLS